VIDETHGDDHGTAFENVCKELRVKQREWDLPAGRNGPPSEGRRSPRAARERRPEPWRCAARAADAQRLPAA